MGRERLYLSFPEEYKEEYEYLKQNRNASALVRYLTRLFMDGYIPNPMGMNLGEQKVHNQSVVVQPRQQQPLPKEEDSNKIEISTYKRQPPSSIIQDRIAPKEIEGGRSFESKLSKKIQLPKEDETFGGMSLDELSYLQDNVTEL